MKVIFIHQFTEPDYLADSFYHGLIDLGIETHLLYEPSYMIKNGPKPNGSNRFNLFNKLEEKPNIKSGTEIGELISSDYYDYVVYANFRKFDLNFWEDKNWLISRFKQNQIIFLDGNDDNYILTGIEQGTLYKRELINDLAKPISFSIPESQLISELPSKEKIMATVIPGDSSTYIFNDEISYNEDYAKSYYGMTTKKSGWDCMRHYEILANRCIPYFPDIENCPSNTMTNFPKEIIKETNKYARQGIVHPEYDSINEELFQWTKENLTTKAVVSKILNI